MVANKRTPGKKTKRDWRKNVDLEDVEQGLAAAEQQRETLGALAADVPDEALFSVNVTGSEELARQQRRFKPLRIDEILAERSRVAAVSRLPRADDGPRICQALKRQVARAQARIDRSGRDTRVAPSVPTSGSFDLWDDAEAAPAVAAKLGRVDPRTALSPDVIAGGFVDHLKPVAVRKPLSVHVPTPVATTKSGDVPAVRVAGPGASYNPASADHAALLTEAIDEELARLQSIEQAEAQLVRTAANASLEDEARSLSDSSESDGETEETTAKTSGRRKTRAERNRQRRNREEARQKHRESQRAAVLEQISRLEAIRAELQQSGELDAASGRFRSLQDALAEPRRRVAQSRLGPHKFSGGFRVVQLTEDLASSLRTLKPEGSVLRDRFTSLQERQLIETRIPVGRRQRYRRRRYEIPSYRLWGRSRARFHSRVQS